MSIDASQPTFDNDHNHDDLSKITKEANEIKETIRLVNELIEEQRLGIFLENIHAFEIYKQFKAFVKMKKQAPGLRGSLKDADEFKSVLSKLCNGKLALFYYLLLLGETTLKDAFKSYSEEDYKLYIFEIYHIFGNKKNNDNEQSSFPNILQIQSIDDALDKRFLTFKDGSFVMNDEEIFRNSFFWESEYAKSKSTKAYTFYENEELKRMHTQLAKYYIILGSSPFKTEINKVISRFHSSLLRFINEREEGNNLEGAQIFLNRCNKTINKMKLKYFNLRTLSTRPPYWKLYTINVCYFVTLSKFVGLRVLRELPDEFQKQFGFIDRLATINL